MDKVIADLLNANFKGWEKFDKLLSAKRAFMTMYLDNTPEGDSNAYYEGWLDALDTVETWIETAWEEEDE